MNKPTTMMTNIVWVLRTSAGLFYKIGL